MALSAGSRLGPYEILASVGLGGQGEVFRAKDTRLDRVVAVKVLLSRRSEDPELRQRFEREARAVSSLNHPHICTLHDVGNESGVDYLVMEYLEGESLADRLKKGPLPLEEALRVAREIADGLDEAHRKGIVHRDLKPGNVMLTRRGAKLLDFGLATRLSPGFGSSRPGDASESPTGSQPLTREGAVVGTFQYMAPEQLEGRDVDARTDVFAFGALLYETVTGRRAFEGTSPASLIAAILEHEPRPVAELQPLAPPALDWLIRGCLEKKPDDRWQSMRDVGKHLAGLGTYVARRPSPRSPRTTALFAGVAILTTAGLALWSLRNPEPRNRETLRFTIEPPEGTSIGGGPSAPQSVISPDGRRVAFATLDGDLWVRALEELEPRQLVAAEIASFPFWSPDGSSIGFFTEHKLMTVHIATGSPQTLCDLPPRFYTAGADWGPDGVILFGGALGISRVSAAGGEPSLVTRIEPSRGETAHYFPQFLPGGRRFLFLVKSSSEETQGIHVGSLDSQETRSLLKTQVRAAFAAPGYLLYVRAGTLFARSLNAETLEWTGEPVPIAESIAYNSANGRTTFSASQTGVLSYRTGDPGGNPLTQLTWFDRAGNRLGTVGPPGYWEHAALSPDQSRVAVSRVGDRETQHIWIGELSSGDFTRFTFGETRDRAVLWSRDGTLLYIASQGTSGVALYQRLASGVGEAVLLHDSPEWKSFGSTGPDGELVYDSQSVETGWDIWVFQRGAREPVPYLRTEAAERNGAVSPDGRWLAYESDETGRREVFVSSFPISRDKWQVSVDGGDLPSWREDGRELFYIAPDSRIMAVEVAANTTFTRGQTRPLFLAPLSTGAGPTLDFDVSSDGTRFLVNALADQGAGAPITVVVNWTAALER
jgi:serine/threonine protein kinase/Tol biopolymer transport system component